MIKVIIFLLSILAFILTPGIAEAQRYSGPTTPPKPKETALPTGPAGVGEIINNPGIEGFKFDPGYDAQQGSLGGLVSAGLVVAWYIATFLTFFWLVWGAFEYLTSGGDKHKVSHARNRMIWAVVGLLVVFSALMISQFIAQILKPDFGTPVDVGK